MGALTYTPILDDLGARLAEEKPTATFALAARLRNMHSNEHDLTLAGTGRTRTLSLSWLAAAHAGLKLKLGGHLYAHSWQS